jgi:WD40 repeat protein
MQFLGTCGDGWIKIWELQHGEEVWKYKFNHWCRAVDWSPDGRFITVDQDSGGGLALFDLTTHQEVSIRPMFQWIPSFEGVKKKIRKVAEGRISVQMARFLPASSGRTAVMCATLVGVEVFDINQNLKYRFAWGEESKGAGWIRVAAQYLERTKQIVVLSGDAISFCDIISV